MQGTARWRWGVGAAVIGCWSMICGEASAEWRQAFRTASDTKIYAYQSDGLASGRILLGIAGGVLESKDQGRTWKRVLTVPAAQPVQVLRREADGLRWWAAAGRTLYRSLDGGRKWEPAAQFSDPENPVQCFLSDDPALYAGRFRGLEMSLDGGTSWRPVTMLAGQSVRQIETDAQGRIWVAASRGIYRRSDSGSWGQVYRTLSLSEAASESVSEEARELGLAEIESGGSGVYFWFSGPEELRITDGNKKFKWQGSTGEVTSDGMMEAELSAAPSGIGALAAALAFEDGIRLSEASAQSLRRLNAGWPPAAETRALTYESSSDRLVAVTDRGVFEYEHPDLSSYLETRLLSGPQKIQSLTAQFDHEPGILELQEAAMRYAEVHPDKILEWRRLAARRAWLPSVTFGQDRGYDQTVDIDRGGTADVDRFIQGPDEEDRQWSVDLQWDLANLIWSTDQTTIDNRSKLMVQLRDEILSQLNQFYYARRRLQIAALIEGSAGLQKETERALQIDEYTAGMDALTGGYFSRASRRDPQIKVNSQIV